MTDPVARSRPPWPAFFTAAVGAFMGTLDGSIVNLALPALADPAVMPGGSFASASWVVIAFFLTTSATLLIGARLGDQLGRRRVYTAGIALFTFASALCAFSPDIRFLIASRVLQALGAALLVANGASILVEAFPPEERGKALGLYGTVVALGLSVGPPLGGLLLQHPGRWPWIFLIDLPVGIIALPLAWRALPPDAPRTGVRFDVAGAVLLAVAMASFGFLVETARDASVPRVLVLAAACAAASAFFVRVERRAPEPLMDLRLFRQPTFSGGTLAVLLAFVALQSITILVPYYLHDLGRIEMATVGLILLASPLSLSVTAPFAGRLSDRIGPRTPATLGMLITAAGYASLGFMAGRVPSPAVVMAHLFAIGLGMGLFMAPNNAAVMGTVPLERLGIAGGVIATMRNLGASAGGALTSVLFSAVFLAMAGMGYGADAARAHPAAVVGAMRAALLMGAAACLAAAVLSALTPREPAATRESGGLPSR